MHIKIQNYLFQSHSWSIIGWNLARILIKLGHEVDLFPTDTNETCHLPEDLKPYLITNPTNDYDCQISYTAPLNWGKYLLNGNKNRFGIWAYESSEMPAGFGKNYKFIDKVLPPSNYCKDIFRRGGIPEEHMSVVPHGINPDDFQTEIKYPIKTDKKFKIGVIILQPHIRKNIPGMLEAFGKAFSKVDDVCLVVKVHKNPNSKAKQQQFYVDFDKCLSNFKKKYPEHAEIRVIADFIPNIIELYNSCDIIFSGTHSEGFNIPALDSLAARKITIMPNYGGHLDFLNENNSLLIDTKEVRCPREAQYWSYSPYASWGNPNIDHAAELLRKAVNEYDALKEKFMPNMKEVAEKYTWENVMKQILGLCE